jgi:hypothetical protein
VLPGPLPKGDALLDSGGHGASERRLVVKQGIIACGHGGVDARLQVSQPTQRADDPPTDLLEDCSNFRIAGRLALEEAWLAALVGPIKIDPLQEDKMKMDSQIDGPTKALDKRDGPRLDLLPFAPACDRLVHVILSNRGAEDSMDFRGQVL